MTYLRLCWDVLGNTLQRGQKVSPAWGMVGNQRGLLFCGHREFLEPAFCEGELGLRTILCQPERNQGLLLGRFGFLIGCDPEKGEQMRLLYRYNVQGGFKVLAPDQSAFSSWSHVYFYLTAKPLADVFRLGDDVPYGCYRCLNADFLLNCIGHRNTPDIL